jgi:hypothetical protein
MNAIARALLVMLAAVAAGCATGPKYAEVSGAIPAIPADQGRIYFYRSGQPFGSGIQPSIMLNGQKVGDSQPNGFFFVDRPPGSYEVVLSTEVDRKLTFTLAPAEERFVRMSVGLGVIVYRVYPELADRATALAEIKDLAYTGPPLAGK